MGREPGLDAGYDEGPAAVVGGVPTTPRRRADHRFVGPDYSIIHPGLFPFNERAQKLATMREWLLFDWKAGWGTDAFEDAVPAGFVFPEPWRSVDDRYEAREIVEENQKALATTAEARKTLLSRAYQIGEVKASAEGGRLRVDVEVKNATDGHNAPTGFINERLVWLHIVVTDAAGNVVFRSGDLDPNGDLRDGHSLFVHSGKAPLDEQLFNLQSKFMTRNLRGGDREQVLAVNYSVDPLPFIRPDTQPTLLQGRTAGARIQKQTLAPLGNRRHTYAIENAPPDKGPYRVKIELKSGMVPVNLVAEVMDMGFDYGMSAAEVARGVVAGHQVLATREVTAGGPAAGPR